MSTPEAKTPSQQPTPLQIRAQFVRDVSFEAPNGPLALMGAKAQPTIKVQMNVRHRPVEPIGYEVGLKLTAESKLDEQTIFICEVDYAALVAIDENIAEDVRNASLSIEIPRLLYPYVRRIACDMVTEGGFPPLVLNPVDFNAFAAQATAQNAEPKSAPEGETIQ